MVILGKLWYAHLSIPNKKNIHMFHNILTPNYNGAKLMHLLILENNDHSKLNTHKYK